MKNRLFSPRTPVALAAGALVISGLAVSATAGATPPSDSGVPGPRGLDKSSLGHEPEHPLPIKAKQDAIKQKALQRVLEGKRPYARGADDTTEVPLEVEGSDRIFTILVEFGKKEYDDSNLPSNVAPGTFDDDAEVPDPQPMRFNGPRHNQIPAPDRSVDNSTIWKKNYSKKHYKDMYFNRMKAYYKRQSSGRYTFTGDVQGWVRVPFNQALYGRDYCGGIVCGSTQALVRDALAVWVQDRLDSGMKMRAIRKYLRSFDQQDRYDIDGDNNFDEPDGFIDHMQIVHAGGDEAAADPIYGSDAIWSHRWYAALQNTDTPGFPGVDIGTRRGAFSSKKIPNNSTGIYAGDYTIQPENGGLGVFAHEYAHDLGLPDLYDTSGNTGGAENNTAFWTLMSSGANIGDGGNTTGDDPTDMGAWELFQLGWLNGQGDNGRFYDVYLPGDDTSGTLSRNVPATNEGAQAAFVVLPDKAVSEQIGEPFEGNGMFWSGSGDDLRNTMTKTDGITAGQLTAKVDYEIEEGWDYAYVEASSDGGQTWTKLDTNLSTDEDPNQQNEGNGITGFSEGWVDLTATLPAGTNALRFRYWTDVAAVERGLLVDNIAIGGTPIGTAENETEGWVFDGFKITSGTEENDYFNAYVLENRQYDGDDDSLATAYNFSFPFSKPDFVETYPYQNGLLISYWNEQYADNNVGDHPGGGEILPVDAHPELADLHWPNGDLARPRIASFDSTFGLENTDQVTLRREISDGEGGYETEKLVIPTRDATSTFDDTMDWWIGDDGDLDGEGNHSGRYQPGWYSVDVPKTGTTIEVTETDGSFISFNVVVGEGIN
ncbi:immune inhibitor A [Nocardioides aestuarii]|uniref:Immune inhibitor A domain-containing protein n=1 Tax=Nocardioides aestuarii TaxID=252231 RepID=A0ABW4TFT5_9ACTN